VFSAQSLHTKVFKNSDNNKTPKSWTLIVLGLIIVWERNLISIVIKKSKQTKSFPHLSRLLGNHRSDAITSVMAFIRISK